MGRERNQKTYDEADGTVTVTSPKGETIFRRQARTPLQALTEFKYACDAWMACMDEATRAKAVSFAQEAAATVSFSPNCEPR